MIITDSEAELEKRLLIGPRAKFPGASMRRENSDLNHNKEEKKKSTTQKIRNIGRGEWTTLTQCSP